MFPQRHRPHFVPTAGAAPPFPSGGTWRPRHQYQQGYRPNYANNNFGNFGRAGSYQQRPPHSANAGPSRGRGRGRSRGRGQHRGGGRHCNNSNMLQFNDQYEQQKQRSIFYCCSCERGFQTQVEQDDHNKEHVVCGLEGCKFEAHSLVVTKHIRMQHEGNLYQRMKNLNTPEDIKRWREERKKNFPTKERFQQKVEERKEKADRREICGAPAGGRYSGLGMFRYKMQQQDNNRYMAFGEYQHRMRRLQYEQNDDWCNRQYAPDPNLRSSRVPFFTLNTSLVVTLENFYINAKVGSDGTLIKEKKVKWKGFKVRKLERLEDSESDGEEEALPISDEEDFYENVAGNNILKDKKLAGARKTETPTTPKPKATPQMGLLLVDYSSASDSDDETDSCEAVAKSAKLTASEQPPKDFEDETLQSSVVGTSTGDSDNNVKGSQSLSDDDETWDDDSVTIDEFEEDAVFKHKPVYLTAGLRSRRKWMREKLLESLLQDQIRKERNTILQACRYITENNFFDAK